MDTRQTNPRTSLGLVLALLALLALCAVPAAAGERPAQLKPEEPAGKAAASPGADEMVLQTGRYRGDTIGILYVLHPEMSTFRLPPDLKPHGSLLHADGWQLVFAQRGADWVILLTDSAGVVTDDVAIVGKVGEFTFLNDCGDEVIPALVETSACAGGATSVQATRAWIPQGGKLVESDQEKIVCSCDLPM
jgi:hypothetical protein